MSMYARMRATMSSTVPSQRWYGFVTFVTSFAWLILSWSA